jgi:hypothetical protein
MEDCIKANELEEFFKNSKEDQKKNAETFDLQKRMIEE